MRTMKIEVTIESEMYPAVDDIDIIEVPMSVLDEIFSKSEDEQEDKIFEYIEYNCELDYTGVKEQDYYIEIRDVDEDKLEEIDADFEENWSFGYSIDIDNIREEYNKIKKGKK